MTNTILALIPTYGVWIILLSVTLSCLAIPIPSSLMVMAAGGFAAAGDFLFWELVAFAFMGFLIGDQILYWVSRYSGEPLINYLSRKPKTVSVVKRAKTLIDHRGLIAIFLSRTILSPLGPYVGCVFGALKMSWLKFTCTATTGAFLWSVGYATLGYTFSTQISQVASLISGSIGVIVAGSIAVGGIYWLYRSYTRQSMRRKFA